ncbi:response regulator transcription factor [Muriicola sp. Z0-33]|uniref:response regulator transcription factor n=1 Tax=Muriicola sp. Z0-33 TaxID=2816957 RepID=UPI002A022040|nr:response regulator transcription factor [Muriicola sp. Z0-33]MCW5517814.1 response regulator transcription factor [Muriicola sp. Z0-33]
MKRTILIFAALIAALLILFQLSKYSYASGDASIEIIIAFIAVIFFFIGIYINKKSRTPAIDNAPQVNKKSLEQLGLSRREYEVLLEISQGLSNKEIATKLFVSESTIKTHVSNLLVKLDAKRRTQAIQKAKTMGILPN